MVWNHPLTLRSISMTAVIYDEKDNIELNKSLSAVTAVKDNLVGKQGAVAFKLDNPAMFTNIQDIFTGNAKAPETKFYFTSGKGKVNFGIDNTIFAPTRLTCLAGSRFKSQYKKQLEEIVFTSKDDLDADKLINLIFLVDFIKSGNLPVSIRSGAYRKLLPKIVDALNEFFMENYSTLFSIYSMFTGMTHIQPPQQELSEEE